MDGCFCKLGVLFVVVIVTRTLLCEVYVKALIFGNSRMPSSARPQMAKRMQAEGHVRGRPRKSFPAPVSSLQKGSEAGKGAGCEDVSKQAETVGTPQERQSVYRARQCKITQRN